MTQNQIQDATVDLANLWFTAAVIAGLVPDTSNLISLSASPTTIAFGNVALGSFKDTTMTIANKGADSLKITSIVSSGSPFSVLATSMSIAPGQSFIDTLRFTPAVTGSASAEIFVTSNAPSSP
ncbi:MAG: choice-of-anchor D domain-containing protein, partial [Bacteroidota bacterium]